MFGLALSLPLVAALLFAPVRMPLDRLAVKSRGMYRCTVAVLVLLGPCSIWFALFVPITVE